MFSTKFVYCRANRLYPENLRIKEMSYYSAIEAMQSEEKKSVQKKYDDNHYGFTIHNYNELFGRLILEINQSGLSWETILKKKNSFRKAYYNFDIKKIAAYTEMDRAILLADPGI